MRDRDFFIGWEPVGPAGTMRFVRKRVVVLLVAAMVLGAVLALSQRPFASSNFEFGVTRTFEGTLEHAPYPVLVVERPGALSPDEDGPAAVSRWMLTVFGKRGADEFTRPLDGRRVRVEGSLIHRDRAVMVEILPDTLVPIEGDGVTVEPGALSLAASWEPVTLQGEIVDSKCFLGVMKPGNLKTHRACATRCISGGVPPVFLVRDAAGNATYYLLVGPEGEAVNEPVLPYVAESIEVSGVASSAGDLRVLRADPDEFRRL